MLALCTEHASLDVVKLLLAAKADFNVHDKLSGDNILHLAVRWSIKIEIIEYLWDISDEVKVESKKTIS